MGSGHPEWEQPWRGQGKQTLQEGEAERTRRGQQEAGRLGNGGGARGKEWGRSEQMAGQMTRRAPGHQSCFWALGAEGRLIRFSVRPSGHVPGGCPWPVSVPAMGASPSPRFAASSLPEGDPRAQMSPVERSPEHMRTCAALCKGMLPGLQR